MTNRKVLVTGGAGYIGAHTAKALFAAGYAPIIFDNLMTGHRGSVRWGPLEAGDLCDRGRLDAVLAAHQPAAVLHFAAKSLVGESVREPLAYYENNVAGTLNLINACVAHGVKDFVFSSTCAVYGMPQRMPIDETHPKHPINPYGRTKRMVEDILGDACGQGLLRASVLRYFNAAGADADGDIGEDHDPETHLIPLVLMAARDDRRTIEIFGTDYDTADGTCVRDYVHVADLAQAHVAALQRLQGGGAGFDAINLGSGVGLSVREIVDRAERITGRSIAVQEGPRREGDPPILLADPAKARDVLGWTPRVSDPGTMITSAWRWLIRAEGEADEPARVDKRHGL